MSTCAFANYVTLSVDSECPVDVIEARNGYGLRLGWVFLFHPPADGGAAISELRELFVWPPFRQQGIGSLLEDVSANVARARHSAGLRVFFHEADAQGRTRRAGREFGVACGYRWVWRRRDHPRLVGHGEKSL